MCNCEGNVYNIGMGCCVPVVANADAYYTKSEVDKKIDEAVIEASGITPSVVQRMIDDSIADKADKSEIPTVPTNVSAFVNDVPYLTQHQDLSNYALKSEIPSVDGLASESYVQGYTYSKSVIDEKVAQGGTFDPTQYYNKTATDNLLAAKADTANTYTQLEVDAMMVNKVNTTDLVDNYYNKTQSDALYALKTDIPSLNGYATEQWVENKGYLTQHQDLSNYALKGEIPDISGKQDISGMTAYTQTTAFTAHTADTNVHVTSVEKSTWNNKVESSTLNNYLLKSKIWCGTQSEYDSILTKDAETIYLIHE